MTTEIKTLVELVQAISDGKGVEICLDRIGWCPFTGKNTSMSFNTVSIRASEGKFRIAKEMTFIEGPCGRFEYPKHVSKENSESSDFFIDLLSSRVLSAGDLMGSERVSAYYAGMAHTTKEDALLHLTAYTAAMGIKGE